MADLASLTISEFLDRLGARTPAPGGGAVCAVVGALGAALGQMVVNYSIGRKSLAEHEPALRAALARLGEMRGAAMGLAAADARAYAALNELWKLPEGDPRRAAQTPGAVRAAIEPPRGCIDLSLEALELLETLAPITNRNLHSDLAICCILARAAADGGRWMISVNAAMLDDQREREETLARAQADCDRAAEICRRIERACQRPPA